MKNLKITNLSDKDINSVNELYNKYISETAFTFDIKEKNSKNVWRRYGMEFSSLILLRSLWLLWNGK